MEFTWETITQAAEFWDVDAITARGRLFIQESRELDRSEGEYGWYRQTDDGPIWIPAFPIPA